MSEEEDLNPWNWGLGPSPFVRDESWKTRAECLGHGSERAQDIAAAGGYDTVLDAMFPKKGKVPTHAVMICSVCPVAKECLEYALVNPGERGVWGGSSPDARAKIRRAEDQEAAIDAHIEALRQRKMPGIALCGSYGAYRRHLREGSEPCAPCRDAAAREFKRINRERARRRRAQEK